MTRRIRILTGATLLILPLQAWAAGETEAALADRCYRGHDWSAVEKACSELAGKDSKNGRAWFRLGVALESGNRLKDAVPAFERAVAIGHNPQVMYRLASAHARLGEKPAALEWLEKAAEAGFGETATLAADAGMAPLREERRYKAAAMRIEVNAHPCVSRPESRQFDFWVGDWEVRTKDGDPAGTNRIQLVVGNCVLLENWTSSRGGTGKSINVYHAGRKKWQQTWVDDQGDVIEYVDGEYREGAMRFRAETTDPGGKIRQRRLTFFNLGPDSVRQLGEQSEDGGRTWATEYDLYYIRKR